MPEQISKYPEVTLEVLEGAGAICGEGAPQEILTQCPTERFCSLPTGEVCVYGIKAIPQMTQITPQELAQVVCPTAQVDATLLASMSEMDVIMLGAAFVAGLALARFWQMLRIRSRSDHLPLSPKRH